MLPINGNVAENSLSMHDLDAVHAWVNHVDNNKVEDKEAANIIDRLIGCTWPCSCILSNDDENKKKKSSIFSRWTVRPSRVPPKN